MDTRQQCIQLICANIAKNYDQKKAIEVLEKGPDDEGLISFQKSMTKISRGMKSSMKEATRF